ncbi:MAG TPA: hypothetical protein DD473_07585 [Planctomycetaceae bacterium]|nr:hypothetical protein [Planctomycetaceae bacterium]
MCDIKTKELFEFANQNTPPLVSVYLPVEITGRESKQNSIRLRNLLKQAESTLANWWFEQPEAEKFINKVMSFADKTVWKKRSQGMVILISDQQIHHYALPDPVPELVFVGDHFYLRPLLPVVQEQIPYMILALSQNHVRLIQVSEGQPTQLRIPELDQMSMTADRAQISDPGLQRHSVGFGKEILHGHQAEPDDPHSKIRLHEFCQHVFDAIKPKLTDKHGPLLLAAENRIAVEFRKVATDQDLSGRVLPGNPDQKSVEDLQYDSLSFISEIVTVRRQKFLGDFLTRHELPDISSDLEVIFEELFTGRLESICLAEDTQVWGLYSQSTGVIEQHSERRDDDEDLLNRLAVYAISHKIPWMTFPADEMPGQSVAIGRFYKGAVTHEFHP